MKLKHFIAAWAVLSGVTLFAQQDVSAAVIKYHVYKPETVAASRCVRLKNGMNDYVLKFVESKPAGGKSGTFQIRMREPRAYYNFSRPIMDFIRIRAGKYWLMSLSPDLTKLKTWKKDDRAGVTLPLNFAGRKMDLTFYMKKDSPVLFAEMTPVKGDLKSTEIHINMIISTFRGIKPVYQRQAETAVGILKQKNGIQQLPKNGYYAIFSDTKFDPAKDKSCGGPCYLQWDPATLQKAQVHLVNGYHTQVQFFPAPAAKAFKFGLLTMRKNYTNNAFKDFVKPYLNGPGK